MSLYPIFRKPLLFGLLTISVLAACKKSSDNPPKTGTRDELTKDSIYLYARETYLWNDALPSSYKSFNPRQYSSFTDELSALKSYKRSSAGRPLDKYSFIDQGEVSDEIGEGISGDYGFFVGYNGLDDGYDPLDLRINYVYEGSPAGVAGLSRGDQILEINGNSNLNGRVDANINFLNNALFGPDRTINLRVRKKDNSIADVSVTKARYNINPILASNVFSVGSKKVGYFVLNSFVQVSGSDTDAPTPFKTQLDAVLNNFQSQNITELVVDLRYNGGGSVETANYLADWFVPAGKSGTVMHVDHFNQTMQSGKATILKNQKFLYEGKEASYFDFSFAASQNTTKFSKKGSLGLSRIYFLVTDNSASASELLINSLAPVMDVKLIGHPTYGKPVGFFAIHIDKYDLYIPQFQTKNQLGAGDYFDGLSVNKELNDDITKAFGDPTERYLASALAYSASGNYTVSSTKTSATARPSVVMSNERFKEVNNKLEGNKFKGMVDKPRKRAQ
ncbi:S41 family peptidase [Arcticibacter tournemirensis]